MLTAFCFCFLAVTAVVTFHYQPGCGHGGKLCSHHDRAVTIVGTIFDQPERKVDVTNYVIKVQDIQGFEKIDELMLLRMPIQPEYYYGDKITFACKLKKPTEAMAIYLAMQNIFTECSYPKNVAKIGQTKSIRYYIYALREHLEKQIIKLWSEPSASLNAGILYGSRSGLPKELKENFQKTSLSHILAVSGYNVSVIAVAFNNLLILIGLWKRQAFWVVAFGVTLFVIFTGAGASVVRAGLMTITVLFGEHIGRPSTVIISLLLAATLMVMEQPLTLLYDIGFQLSFAATAGLIYLSGPIKRRLPDNGCFEMLSVSAAAQIATTPFIVYHFGSFSLAGLAVNLLIVWIVPWLMLTGFMALIVSFVYFPAGQMMAFINQAGIAYILTVVNWFARQDWCNIILWQKTK